MTGPAKRIAEAIAQAMQTETDGYHFYTMAANTTSDEKGKEVFTQLALEEMSHLKLLKAQHDAVISTGRADPSVKVGKASELGGESPIFSAKIRERLGEAHFEMSALSIAIKLELSSEKHYREQARLVENPDLEVFFDELADWEAGHYQALLRQLDELKEDYWSGGGFAPW